MPDPAFDKSSHLSSLHSTALFILCYSVIQASAYLPPPCPKLFNIQEIDFKKCPFAIAEIVNTEKHGVIPHRDHG